MGALAVGIPTALLLRARLPRSVVAALLSGSGAVLGWGGMLLQPDPSPAETVLAVLALAALVPFHVRVVLGPFGSARRRELR